MEVTVTAGEVPRDDDEVRTSKNQSVHEPVKSPGDRIAALTGLPHVQVGDHSELEFRGAIEARAVMGNEEAGAGAVSEGVEGASDGLRDGARAVWRSRRSARRFVAEGLAAGGWRGGHGWLFFVQRRCDG